MKVTTPKDMQRTAEDTQKLVDDLIQYIDLSLKSEPKGKDQYVIAIAINTEKSILTSALESFREVGWDVSYLYQTYNVFVYLEHKKHHERNK